MAEDSAEHERTIVFAEMALQSRRCDFSRARVFEIWYHYAPAQSALKKSSRKIERTGVLEDAR